MTIARRAVGGDRARADRVRADFGSALPCEVAKRGRADTGRQDAGTEAPNGDFDKMFDGVPEEDARRILGGNLAAHLELEEPEPAAV